MLYPLVLVRSEFQFVFHHQNSDLFMFICCSKVSARDWDYCVFPLQILWVFQSVCPDPSPLLKVCKKAKRKDLSKEKCVKERKKERKKRKSRIVLHSYVVDPNLCCKSWDKIKFRMPLGMVWVNSCIAFPIPKLKLPCIYPPRNAHCPVYPYPVNNWVIWVKETKYSSNPMQLANRINSCKKKS